LLPINKLDESASVYNGVRYWKWQLSEEILAFEDWEIKDFVVLLPKLSVAAEEYTMIRKEWSPAMLENYNYANVGTMTTKEIKSEVDRWG
jgi:hypothetical protein